jgi:hypothetical protein
VQASGQVGSHVAPVKADHPVTRGEKLIYQM